MSIYCTSFCNKAHVVSSGKPVGHQCYVLPPSAIRAEMSGSTGEANAIISTAGLPVHRGVAFKFEDQIHSIIPYDDDKLYDVVFHELCWEGGKDGGWSVNDSWYGARGVEPPPTRECDRASWYAHRRRLVRVAGGSNKEKTQ